MNGSRLLAGPDPRNGAESLREHRRRLGPEPAGSRRVIDTLARSGLLGRGGAAFPVGVKWRSVTDRSRGGAVVLVNGAEGEPLSWKDRLLLEARPHLVLDGAFIAAGTVGADQVVLYVGERHRRALEALNQALEERPPAQRRLARIVSAPPRYIAGEESAAVHFVQAGVATPTTVPPRPFERGVDGRPTLVQNVETLAQVALIARYGDAWFREAGAGRGTLLVSLSGAVASAGVLEVDAGSSLGEVVTTAGGLSEAAQAVLLGGYFGSWVHADQAWGLPLDAPWLRSRGWSLGCGVISVLGRGACGVCETARVMRYLAAESSAQCGPCYFGLRSLADACTRIARGEGGEHDLERLQRWSMDVRGRGACRHPDGAVTMLRSGLEVFSDEFRHHSGHAHAEAA
ncbi:MAG: SLBB domain-containing protein [Candidatus Dormibacteraeota bacterium]|nr:SLBB domain-containing protein [Candidatus Dormibacteraeota bacterium]